MSSPPDVPRRPRWWRPAGLLAFVLAGLLPVAGLGSLRLDIGRIEHPRFLVDGLHIELQGRGGAAELAVDRLVVGDHHWDRLRLTCPDFRFADGRLHCPGGSLAIPGIAERVAIDLTLDPDRRSGSVRLGLGDGEVVHIGVEEGGAIRVDGKGLDLTRLGRWLPDVAAYSPRGRVDVEAEWTSSADGGALSARGEVREGAFSTADGLHAAEGIRLGFDATARTSGGGWAWRGGLAWKSGEAYLHPIYLTAGPVLQASGRLADGRLSIDEAQLELEGVRRIAGNAVIDLASRTVERGAVALADADLAVVGPRYLAPLIAPGQADVLRFAGRVSAGVTLSAEGLSAVDAAFDDAGFSHAGKGLSVGPLSGEVPWRRDRATVARLSVGGGRWEKLQLGAFELAARLHGDEMSLDRVRIPVLDGALVLHDLSLRRGAEGWEGRGGAVVEPIAMDRLTGAVGLPTMSGTLAASLPGVTVAPGVLTLDGALVVSVFDGYVQLTGLKVLEPFGVAAHAYADVEARRLDLAQITETFDFGSISGYIDLDLRGLELARWRPVRFDARLASSPGDYRKRISQRAVENISALGGRGAAAAIQRSFLRFFETFGYREIGLSCALRDGVCRMGGIEDAPAEPGGGFLIVSGGGVPALNVIGYNRRVDWNELVERLQQAIASNTAPVVR